MRKCKNCKVTVIDPVLVCPLCHCVLENENQEMEAEEQQFIPRMYPDVKETTRALNFIVKLYTFLAIVTQVGLFFINYMTFSGLWWSAISGIGLLYFYITLRYSVLKNSGYQKIILTQIFCGMFLSIGIDFILGYRGWSVNFMVPIAILLIDLAVVILMIVNTANWQSYILLQLLAVLLSIVILIFWKVGIIQYPLLTIITTIVSAVMFVGTLIFGDRRAKNELKRRFHM